MKRVALIIFSIFLFFCLVPSVYSGLLDDMKKAVESIAKPDENDKPAKSTENSSQKESIETLPSQKPLPTSAKKTGKFDGMWYGTLGIVTINGQEGTLIYTPWVTVKQFENKVVLKNIRKDGKKWYSDRANFSAEGELRGWGKGLLKLSKNGKNLTIKLRRKRGGSYYKYLQSITDEEANNIISPKFDGKITFANLSWDDSIKQTLAKLGKKYRISTRHIDIMSLKDSLGLSSREFELAACSHYINNMHRLLKKSGIKTMKAWNLPETTATERSFSGGKGLITGGTIYWSRATKKMFVCELPLSDRKDDIKAVMDKLDSKYGDRITEPMPRNRSFFKWGNHHNAVILAITDPYVRLYYVNYDNIRELNKKIANFIEKLKIETEKAKKRSSSVSLSRLMV